MLKGTDQIFPVFFLSCAPQEDCAYSVWFSARLSAGLWWFSVKVYVKSCKITYVKNGVWTCNF